eukprot:TRINITY_DN17072_c0_g1_i1.p1 TRINITY_DN17072_c0_g1~~TRINITY_DN17072_c0_g1_i1.p1  ORF type:complete len:301 (-),score=11.54 TRINITY_DN17072_c0_g1_i1:217-1119(-)
MSDTLSPSEKDGKVERHNLNNSWVHMAAGSVGGGIASIIVQPLDVIRTRMQKPIESSASAQTRNSMLKTFADLVRNEGVMNLWKGTSPTLYRTVPGAGLYFLVLEKVTSALKSTNDGKLSPLGSLVAGSGSRALVTTMLIPVTVVKTRFEAFEKNPYRGTADALRTIAAKEGFKSLYSGLAPTILRDVPFSGIYLLCYEQSKNFLHGLGVHGVVANISAGLIGGTIATVVTHPTDVIKTRLQLPPSETGVRHTSLSLFNHLIKNEGISGLYKGFLPRLIRRPIMTALTWAIYEEMKSFLS